VLRQSLLSRIPRCLGLVAGAGAALLLASALTGATASAATGTIAPAATSAPGAPSGPHRQAYDPVTGMMVTVYKPTSTTPVHSEEITHPQLDYMGSTITAHDRSGAPAAAIAAAASGLPGIDVSAYQGNLNWASIAPSIDFSYAKATEGTYYTNPDFTNQYVGPYNQGVIRGAYHFAIPNNSGGATQADYFAHHGGGWSADGRTLPGALDIEYNPYSGGTCYGLSKSAMTSWIWSFVDEYAFDTGVYPVIYSTYNWWSTCTGNASGFQNYDPFWIACYCSTAGTLPAGYGFYTFWQYADSGSLPGDQDVFNGAYSRLQALASG
jgi:GH25 family lysozyme M1 (1,4-beta-N-acetylmuramidase)